MTQNNLGLAYKIAFGGSGPTIWSRRSPPTTTPCRSTPARRFPENWAMTQNNLGLPTGNRIRGERADNLEQAIAAYEAP
jgi:hypothetical protein